ncbi:MAG: hypothetical protein QIT35_gp71 [Methanophagales virus PBV299]|uniref:Uncharacterized protein n=1 Tax=Methanophagales virus PBV299 TaxID=2987730 RepID=A0ABY6GLI6_9CAUD|nr:MAG: hypothetical protein QIT35_gp71 [Methanophagales virus PBV299]UYL64867.1 MAG: hypothetical protein OFDIEDLO_00071 [Methanophagales virus PBV299]
MIMLWKNILLVIVDLCVSVSLSDKKDRESVMSQETSDSLFVLNLAS